MKRRIVEVELVESRYAARGSYSCRIKLDCGHVLVRKYSAYRGKTAECRECVA